MKLLLPYCIFIAVFGCAIDKEALEKRAAGDQHKLDATFKPLPTPLPTPPPANNALAYRPYILGVEDVVKISVINQTDLNTVQSIRPDGMISFYPTGDLVASGLTVQQLREKIINGLKNVQSKPYILDVGDVLTISVYNNSELTATQAIRPDGKITIISTGDILAQRKTVDELRSIIEKKLKNLIKNPIVNVMIKEYKSKPIIISKPIVNITIVEYNSKKVSILGELEKPGILRLKSEVRLIEGISQMGGLTSNANLKRAMLFRNQKLLPVKFEKLFKNGDISQNIVLNPNDVIFIPSSLDNKVYVIGEVQKPGIISWKGDLSLLKAVSMAGGYGRNAQNQNVLVIKGDINDPKLMLVDAESITKRGDLENNVSLESGDIVYVPKTIMASVEQYFKFASTILGTVLALESGVVLGDQVKTVLTGGRSSIGINVSP